MKHRRFYHAISHQGQVPCGLRKAGANARSRNNVWLALKFIMAILQPSVARGILSLTLHSYSRDMAAVILNSNDHLWIYDLKNFFGCSEVKFFAHACWKCPKDGTGIVPKKSPTEQIILLNNSFIPPHFSIKFGHLPIPTYQPALPYHTTILPDMWS